MNISIVLSMILLILMVIIGHGRGLKSFITLFFNMFILFFMLLLIAAKFDPIRVTVIGCILISYVTLFYINGINKKTVASLISITLVVLLTMLIIYKIGNDAEIQGFANEQSETIAYLSPYVQLNFSKIVICQVLIGLLGAIIDVSISISSSMNEIQKNDVLITQKKLFESGMNIGKDILGTMTNTLLFAYIGGFMTLIIFFNELHYSIADILNAKVFCAEVFQIFCGGIGIILIIPITAMISSIILFLRPNIKEKATL
jgi:uncharacterized membrane protein